MDVDFPAHRVKMVDSQLRTTDVTNVAILNAMGTVPREIFVPFELRGLAYTDHDLRLSAAGGGIAARYLMEPSLFARLLQLAAIRPSDAVLEIGCATGYSTAVLSRLAASVVAVESDPDLAATAVELLASLDCANASVVHGPLTQGHPSRAPYDVIVIGGCVETLPEAFWPQLAEDGRLVAVEGHGNAAWARLYLKRDGAVTGRSAFNAAVKPLPGFESARVFEF